MKFIGRKKELEILNRLNSKKTSSLAVIWGRRRIGKSRLIEEFLKGKKAWRFIGLPPTSTTTSEDQLEAFSQQMSRNLRMPHLKATNWADLFWTLGKWAKTEESLVIVLDEISWMGSKDPNFLGYLKTEWDKTFSRHPNLILILCGSISSWIEKNILSSTGFLGRISIQMEVKELPINDCNQFWGRKKDQISAYEKLKLLSITGGVPKYLEEVLPGESIEKNIQHLCFSPEGLLFNEYDQIFSDLFNKRASTFDKIVQVLAEGAKNLDEICLILKTEKSGNITRYLHELILAGFVAEDATWNLKTKKVSRLKKFRLRDNYLRFHSKFIKPNQSKIRQGNFKKPLENFQSWESIIALQFENLVLNNILPLTSLLGLQEFEIAGSYFQRKTKDQQGCQIDLMIQAKFNTLYLCEIKFMRQGIGKKVIDDVKQKMDRLAVPKGFSIRPVLIHVNGHSHHLLEEEFFDKIIDFSDLLNLETNQAI